MSSDKTIYRVRGRVVIRHIGEDRLLVPVSGTADAGARVYPVNETAECVWNSLANGATVDQAVTHLTARYAVSEAEARTDCESCLAAFLVEQLLEKVVS